MATFGENLAVQRERAGFRTAKSLAEALAISPSVVSRWENNLTGLPEGPTLLKLAKILDCSVEDLLAGVDPDYAHALARRAMRRAKREDWLNTLPADRVASIRKLDQDMAAIELQESREETIEHERREELRERWITPARAAAYERHRDFFYRRARRLELERVLAGLASAPDAQRVKFGEAHREVRERMQVTVEELSKQSGVPPHVISTFEATGRIEADALYNISELLYTWTEDPIDPLLERDLEWLIATLDKLIATPPAEGVADDTTGEVIDVSNYHRRDIPVFGQAEATTDGLIAWSDEGLVRNQVDHWVSRPFNLQDAKAYGLVVRGDSMVPRYFPGETLIASPNAAVKSGNFACVQLHTGAAPWSSTIRPWSSQC